MDIERWLDKEIIKIIERGASKRALASLIKDALAKAREQSITASEMTIFLTNAFFDSSIKMIEDAWVECGCRYAEMVILIRDKIGNEQTIELRV
jgi:purine-nucleoside phosphorylase